MFHLLPDKYKRAHSFQMIILITVLISGFLVLPIYLIAYLLLYKSHKVLYKMIVHKTCYFLWIHFTYIAQWWNGLRIKLYIKPESVSHIGKENALILMNHKYDIDWLTTWIFAESYGVLGGGISFAKKSLKYVPIIGWIWQFNGTIFLERNWIKDKSIINNSLKDFGNTFKGYYNVLLLYPEGTRFTKKKLETSNEFARSRGMPELKHCLQPRTKGFIEVIKSLRDQVDVIYDLTVAFPDSMVTVVEGVNSNQPPFTMSNILSARVKTGDLAMERILMKDLPHDEEKLGEWLFERFQIKDELFEHYVHTGKFEGPSIIIKPSYKGLIIHTIVTIFLWVPLSYWLCLLLWSHSWMIRLMVVVSIISMFVFVQLILNVTRTEKGSTYGSKKNK